MRIVTAATWMLAVALAACAGTRASPVAEAPPAPAFPRSFETARTGLPGHVYVQVVDREGAPVSNARIQLHHLGDAPRRLTGGLQTTDGLGRAILGTEAPGLYRIALDETPGVASGWLRRGVHAHSVRVRVEQGEAIGHGVRIVAPRPGGLEMRVDRRGLAADERVSVTLRRRYPSGDLLHRRDSNTRPTPFFDDARGSESWLWEELPEGRYVARISVPEKRTTRLVAAEVTAGAVTTVDTAPGPRGTPLVISYDGPRDADTKQHVWLNPMDGRPDLVRGSLHEGPHTSYAATPGRYVAILPRGGAAMVVDVPEVAAGEQVRMRLTPPAWTRPAEGGADVTVRVLRDGERVGGVFLGLTPPAPDHLRSGSWLRVGNTYKVEGVPPGDWDVVLLNRVYSDLAGIPAPIVRRVRVGAEDVELIVRVSTE